MFYFTRCTMNNDHTDNADNIERFTRFFSGALGGPVEVSDQINYYLKKHPDTRIVSMTSGVLLKCYCVIAYMERVKLPVTPPPKGCSIPNTCYNPNEKFRISSIIIQEDQSIHLNIIDYNAKIYDAFTSNIILTDLFNNRYELQDIIFYREDNIYTTIIAPTQGIDRPIKNVFPAKFNFSKPLLMDIS